MSATVTFDGPPPPGTINLGIGQPSADLLPVDLVRKASEPFFDSAQPFELNYGAAQGDKQFLHSLAGFLTASYGSVATPESLFVTGGNSQALDPDGVPMVTMSLITHRPLHISSFTTDSLNS